MPGRLRRARPRPVAHRRACRGCSRPYAARDFSPLAAGVAGALAGFALNLVGLPIANAPARGYRFARHMQTLQHLCIDCAVSIYQPAPEPCETELQGRHLAWLLRGSNGC